MRIDATDGRRRTRVDFLLKYAVGADFSEGERRWNAAAAAPVRGTTTHHMQRNAAGQFTADSQPTAGALLAAAMEVPTAVPVAAGLLPAPPPLVPMPTVPVAQLPLPDSLSAVPIALPTNSQNVFSASGESPLSSDASTGTLFGITASTASTATASSSGSGGDPSPVASVPAIDGMLEGAGSGGWGDDLLSMLPTDVDDCTDL